MQVAPSRERRPLPRELTAEVRMELGLPDVELAPYRWAFASLVVGTACIPLILAKLWTLTALALFIGFVVVPVVRWFEYRDVAWRDEVYRRGNEAPARVLDVEPAGARRRDHLVRVEFSVAGKRVHASVIGSPLARKGLAPGESVVVIYAPERPERCLIVRRSALEIVDAN